MEELIKDVWMGVKIASFIMTCTMGATFGIAVVCRWMEWSPVNITVNVTHREPE
jgi:hypothetical protein